MFMNDSWPLSRVNFKIFCLILRHLALQMVPFLPKKLCLAKGLFCSKLKFLHACFINFKSNKNSIKSNILKLFYLTFSDFCFQKGSNFQPYQRMGSDIPKWHTHIQKLGRVSPPPPEGHDSGKFNLQKNYRQDSTFPLVLWWVHHCIYGQFEIVEHGWTLT